MFNRDEDLVQISFRRESEGRRKGCRDGEGKGKAFGARSPLIRANYTVLYHSSSTRVLVEAL